MSKKIGLDKVDKWDRNFNDWESSEYYYSQDEQNDYEEEDEEEDKEYESRKH